MVKNTTSQRAALLSFLLALPVAVLGSGCGEDGGSWAAHPDQGGGVLEGRLTVHLFDMGERAEMLHVLRLADGQQRVLHFDSRIEPAPELSSGLELRVFGADDGRAVAVSRFEVLAAPADVEVAQSALIDGVKKPAKRWAFVLIDSGAGVNVTKEAAMEKLFSDGPGSIRSYYKEVSYGLQDLSGDVLGPFQITPPTGGLCQNFVSVAEQVFPMLPGNYNQYLWYIGSKIASCPWGGVAQLGTAAGPTRHSFYNASSECVVLVQEPGHNFGMVHSSSLRCVRAGAAASMIAGAEEGQCTHNEYGNPFDPMGGGGGGGSQQNLNRCLHMNGVQKAYQDWLGGCNIVKATTSGRFTIYPLEKTCNGVQLLQVPLASARTLRFPPSPAATLQQGIITSYYVELRAPVGLDVGLQTPRVFIVAAGDLREARLRGNPNWLIDTTPETGTINDAALGVGKTFTDPALNGPRITVVSADATKAVIQVQLGTTGGPSPEAPGVGVCSDDSAFTAPGTEQCLGEPAPMPAPMAPPTTEPPTGGVTLPPGAGIGTPPTGGAAAPSVPPAIASPSPVQGGIGCTVGEPPTPAPLAWLMALLGLLLLRGRRRP
jgi:MYXO-CTERM domain-containing protein